VATSGVMAAVEQLQCLVEADGGVFDLVGFDDATGVLHLRLVTDNVTCAECILPPDQLAEIATAFVRRTAAEVARVDLDDPRRASG
jgi:hypothetical protein